MQELLINGGQLIQQRNELENKQKQLGTLLNSSPVAFDESQFFYLFLTKDSHLHFRYNHLSRRN